MGKWAKIAIGAAAIAFLMFHPMTRQVVLFILPLGSGFDDFVFFAAVIIGIVAAILHYTGKLKFLRKPKRMTKIKIRKEEDEGQVD